MEKQEINRAPHVGIDRKEMDVNIAPDQRETEEELMHEKLGQPDPKASQTYRAVPKTTGEQM